MAKIYITEQQFEKLLQNSLNEAYASNRLTTFLSQMQAKYGDIHFQDFQHGYAMLDDDDIIMCVDFEDNEAKMRKFHDRYDNHPREYEVNYIRTGNWRKGMNGGNVVGAVVFDNNAINAKWYGGDANSVRMNNQDAPYAKRMKSNWDAKDNTYHWLDYDREDRFKFPSMRHNRQQ